MVFIACVNMLQEVSEEVYIGAGLEAMEVMRTRVASDHTILRDADWLGI